MSLKGIVLKHAQDCNLIPIGEKYSEYNHPMAIKLAMFSRLIVNDCINFCHHDANTDPYDYIDIGFEVQSDEIENRIKTHFQDIL